MKPLSQRHAEILSRFDAGITPAILCQSYPKGVVYSVLRQHRPTRSRAPRTRTSAIPAQVVALANAGMSAARIAAALGISKAYAHRLLK
jgi:hypothetical protein